MGFFGFCLNILLFDLVVRYVSVILFYYCLFIVLLFELFDNCLSPIVVMFESYCCIVELFDLMF